MADDTKVAELASLLEIDVADAREALKEAGGDVSAAIDVVRTRLGAQEPPAEQGEAQPAPQDHLYEWDGVGSSLLTAGLEHRLRGEPPLRERDAACELRALEAEVPPRELLPMLCEASRERRRPEGAAAGLLGRVLPARAGTVASLSQVSLQPGPSTPAQRPRPETGGQPSREALILEGSTRLLERLERCGLRQMQVPDDGNCLFRACALQLYGGAGGRHHPLVRHRAVAEMHRCGERYRQYFGSEEEFGAYLTEMAAPSTWGDELVVRAIADAYGATVHVVTSSEDNWYLVYAPALAAPEGPAPDGQTGQGRHIFLTYLSPIHYSGFEGRPLRPSDIVVHVKV